MQDLLKQFGIEPTLLIAQIINFSILLFVLTKFLYKPILKAIDKVADDLDMRGGMSSPSFRVAEITVGGRKG